MKLFARTKNNKFIEVHPGDCPVRVNEEDMILSRIENSDICYDGSISRVSDDGTLIEFSYILSKNYRFLGFLVYKDGFVGYDDRVNIYFPLEPDFKYVTNENISKIRKLRAVADPIVFQSEKGDFLLKEILGSYGDTLLLHSRVGMVEVDINTIKFNGGNSDAKEC